MADRKWNKDAGTFLAKYWGGTEAEDGSKIRMDLLDKIWELTTWKLCA